MTDVNTVVQRYIDTWNETDPRRRRALIADVFTEDAGYTDPLAAVRGQSTPTMSRLASRGTLLRQGPASPW